MGIGQATSSQLSAPDLLFLLASYGDDRQLGASVPNDIPTYPNDVLLNDMSLVAM